jgi:peptidoglycan hydrolase CwlO-like protein
MKTLFIAALVGLLVVPVVGNAVKHNRIKSTEWDKIRHHQRVMAHATAKREEARKKIKNIHGMIDAMYAHAKNAPDKLQKDWALGAMANLEKLRRQYRKEFGQFDTAIKEQQRKICGLYDAHERVKHKACHANQRTIIDAPPNRRDEEGPNKI